LDSHYLRIGVDLLTAVAGLLARTRYADTEETVFVFDYGPGVFQPKRKGD
jgi:hypothetical protein